MAQTARQEVGAKKGEWIKERRGGGSREEGQTRASERGESRGGVATGSGWISFRLVPLMSVMRAAGPLLPF